MTLNYFKKTNKDYTRNDKGVITGGYTIIEMMIAISIFLIVVTIGMNALLNANVLFNKSKNMREIMDNLSFVMEDMTKSIRTGSVYRCDSDFVTITPKSCSSGGTISFTEAITGDRWVYRIISTDGGVTYNILKSVNGGVNFVQLNGPSILISSFSGFSVLGAEPLSLGNNQQPLVNIRLVGEIHYKDLITPFSLQSSVSQTLIDIGT